MITKIARAWPHETICAIEAAEMFGIGNADAKFLLDDPTGMCLLALMANAHAKHIEQAGQDATENYRMKSILLRRAIRHAADWWAAPHPYGEKGYADTVVYIETPIARFAFHCRADHPQLEQFLRSHPTSDRGWSGRALQPFAGRIASAYLAGQLRAEADTLALLDALAV